MNRNSTKRIVTIMMIMMLIITSAAYAKTEDKSENLTNEQKAEIQAKKDLVKQAEREYKNSKKSISNSEIGEKILLDLYFKGFSEEEISAEVNQYGIYILDTSSSEEEMVSLRSAGSDVTVSKPSISYNANTRQWTIVGGMYWDSESAFFDDAPLNLLGGYKGGNIGDVDLAGLSITNVNGNTSGIYITDTYLYIGNESGLNTNTKYDDIVTNDDLNGVAISYQDRYTQVNGGMNVDTTANFNAFGYRWGIVAHYSSEFSNISCNVKSYYLHTYSSAEINSVSFDSSGMFSVDVSNASYSWPKYSNTASH